mgnify:CR=1 FL=1
MNVNKLQFLKGFIAGFLFAILLIVVFVIVALYSNLDKIL